MYPRSFSAIISLGFAALSSAISIHKPYSNHTNHIPFPSHLVHQFPDPTWVENIRVRSTGELVLTLVTKPDVYYVDPACPSTATLIHNFPQNLAILGITEVQLDQFYVLGSNFTLSPVPNLEIGTDIIYSIDLSNYRASTNSGAIISKIADVPKISFGNGMDTLDASRKLIVIGDSIQGAAWLFNVETGDYSIILREPEMAPPPASGGSSLGINGIRVLPKAYDEVYIYWDNTNAHLFCRVPFSLSTLAKTGPVEILANFTSADLTTDDFALDEKEGYAYLACQQNQILRVPLGGGEAVSVLGGLNSTVVAGPTSVAVARGDECEGTIYVTTNGGLLTPVNGTFTEGGEVIAVKTKRK
ncbi:hypothetical protein D0Z07_8056 [Hyphodiscus hymeniophilus]|uniref:Uncharacterized protein n=1 Tax=Hyphodiscus hymeniophilus TaxID=353542 RepID=A0A9P6SLH1_9HELO|nr:hypothetical protein D0Z07_8056 [Hyphodiscus hymeniophilus]